MGFFNNLFNNSTINNGSFDLQTVYNLSNGKVMQKVVQEEARLVLSKLAEDYKCLSAKSYVTMEEYPIDLNDAQAYAVSKIVDHKRQGKFALANHEYIEMINKGPISWSLLTSWMKILMSLSLIEESIKVAEYCELLLKKRGKWSPGTRSHEVIYTIQSGNKKNIQDLIIAYSGIPEFTPLNF